MDSMERIASRQNAVVKRFRGLHHGSQPIDPTSDGADADAILLDGEHLVQEALACAIPIEVAAFADRQFSVRPALPRLADGVRGQGGRVLLVTDDVMAAMSPVRKPSGVAAIGRARRADLREVLRAARDRDARRPVALVVAGVQDPGNVGAILRTAAAFAAAGVVTVEGSADPFGWKSLRGGMGGTFRLPIAARQSLAEVIAAAHSERIRIVAAVPRGGIPLPDLELLTPAVVVLGGEGAGVPGLALAEADTSVTIPMSVSDESLNVAVAAALILYEASRQRHH